jgi:hypothetical protein
VSLVCFFALFHQIMLIPSHRVRLKRLLAEFATTGISDGVQSGEQACR